MMKQVVHVIDNDELSGQNIAALIKSMRFPAETYDSVEGYLRSTPDAQVGCIVSEMRFRGSNGLELQLALRERNIETPVVFVTAFAKTRLTVQAVRNGAVDVLDKPYDDDELWNAIRAALTIDAEQTERRNRLRQIQRRFTELNVVEKQVMDLIVGGKTNREIADQLGVSVRTVEARRHNVFAKTHTRSVADLVRFVVELGIFPKQPVRPHFSRETARQPR